MSKKISIQRVAGRPKSSNVQRALRTAASPRQAAVLKRFFKTGKGEYGYGDRFIGVMVPQQRLLAKQFRELPLTEVAKLLASRVHEHRLTGLLILTYAYARADQAGRKSVFDFFVRHRRSVNNWDLVDVATPSIMGDYLLDKPKTILYRWAKSKNMWERRMALLATFSSIRTGDFHDAFRIVRLLLDDPHDLIHKASGWMLREIGKRDERALKKFLDRHAGNMPRTTLRYAIERLPEAVRRRYLLKY